jgi:hypothetical protein
MLKLNLKENWQQFTFSQEAIFSVFQLLLLSGFLWYNLCYQTDDPVFLCHSFDDDDRSLATSLSIPIRSNVPPVFSLKFYDLHDLYEI